MQLNLPVLVVSRRYMIYAMLLIEKQLILQSHLSARNIMVDSSIRPRKEACDLFGTICVLPCSYSKARCAGMRAERLQVCFRFGNLALRDRVLVATSDPNVSCTTFGQSGGCRGPPENGMTHSNEACPDPGQIVKSHLDTRWPDSC